MYRKTTTASRREYRNEKTRYLHVSCQAWMVNHPHGIHLPMIPWVERPGRTYDEGRNEAKRQRRALRAKLLAQGETR